MNILGKNSLIRTKKKIRLVKGIKRRKGAPEMK